MHQCMRAMAVSVDTQQRDRSDEHDQRNDSKARQSDHRQFCRNDDKGQPKQSECEHDQKRRRAQKCTRTKTANRKGQTRTPGTGDANKRRMLERPINAERTTSRQGQSRTNQCCCTLSCQRRTSPNAKPSPTNPVTQMWLPRRMKHLFRKHATRHAVVYN